MFTRLIKTRFARFCLIGAITTLTHVVVFVALIELGGVPPVAASIPSFVLAMLISYMGNYSWTFGSNGLHVIQMPKYVVVAIIGLLMNVVITYIIVDVWGGWYGFALAVVVLTVPAMTYRLNHLWVFRKTEQAQHEPS